MPGELAVKCIERWKIMSDRERKWFNHMAAINSPSLNKSDSGSTKRFALFTFKSDCAAKKFWWFLIDD